MKTATRSLIMENTKETYKDSYITTIPCKRRRKQHKSWFATNIFKLVRLILVITANVNPIQVGATRNTDSRDILNILMARHNIDFYLIISQNFNTLYLNWASSMIVTKVETVENLV